MPLPERHAGRRSIKYDNLGLCVVVIATAFVAFLHLLTPAGLQEFSDISTNDEGSENVTASWPYVYVISDHTRRVRLPGRLLKHSVLLTDSSSLVDGIRKLHDFFALPVRLTVDPAIKRGDGDAGRLVEDSGLRLSELFRHLLDRKRFHGRAGLLSSGVAANVFDIPQVLHLCSGGSCVGPELSLGFARQTRNAAANPMIIQALLLGQRWRTILVGRELYNNGVRVPLEERFPRRRVALEKLFEGRAVEWEDADSNVRLFGLDRQGKAEGALPYSLHSFDACGKTAARPGRTRAPIVTPVNESRWFDKDPVAALLLGGKHAIRDHPWIGPTATTSLREIKMAQRGRSELSSLHNGLVDLVSAIDVDAGDAAGIAAYLGGLCAELPAATLQQDVHKASFIGPQNIIIPVHVTEWVTDIFAQIVCLKDSHHYAVVTIFCNARSQFCKSGSLLSGDDIDHLSDELRFDALASATTNRAWLRMRDAERPLLMLLTREFTTPERLAKLAAEIRQTARQTSSLSLHDAADAFFSPKCSGCLSAAAPKTHPRAAHFDLDIMLTDSVRSASSSLGHKVFQIALLTCKTLLLGLPVAICVFLIFNVTKSWRRG